MANSNARECNDAVAALCLCRFDLPVKGTVAVLTHPKSTSREKEAWRSNVQLRPFVLFHLRWKSTLVNVILDISRSAENSIFSPSYPIPPCGGLWNTLLWAIRMTSSRSGNGTGKIVKERAGSSLGSLSLSVVIAPCVGSPLPGAAYFLASMNRLFIGISPLGKAKCNVLNVEPAAGTEQWVKRSVPTGTFYSIIREFVISTSFLNPFN